MTVPAFQVASVAEIDLEYFDALSLEGADRPLLKRGMNIWRIHNYISFFLIILRIWVEWARTIPATMADPTCTASIISSWDTPRDMH